MMSRGRGVFYNIYPPIFSFNIQIDKYIIEMLYIYLKLEVVQGTTKSLNENLFQSINPISPIPISLYKSLICNRSCYFIVISIRPIYVWSQNRSDNFHSYWSHFILFPIYWCSDSHHVSDLVSQWSATVPAAPLFMGILIKVWHH